LHKLLKREEEGIFTPPWLLNSILKRLIGIIRLFINIEFFFFPVQEGYFLKKVTIPPFKPSVFRTE